MFDMLSDEFLSLDSMEPATGNIYTERFTDCGKRYTNYYADCAICGCEIGIDTGFGRGKSVRKWLLKHGWSIHNKYARKLVCPECSEIRD